MVWSRNVAPVFVKDVVRINGAVISGNPESLDESLGDPTDDESEDPTNHEFIDPIVTGGVGTTTIKRCPRRRSLKSCGHTGSIKVDDPINVGGHTSEAIRVGDKKPLSSFRRC